MIVFTPTIAIDEKLPPTIVVTRGTIVAARVLVGARRSLALHCRCCCCCAAVDDEDLDDECAVSKIDALVDTSPLADDQLRQFDQLLVYGLLQVRRDHDLHSRFVS